MVEIISALALATSLLSLVAIIIFVILKSYDRYNNPHKYKHKKLDSKNYKIEYDKLETLKAQEKLDKTKVINAFKESKVQWKKDKLQGNFYAKPSKKAYLAIIK